MALGMSKLGCQCQHWTDSHRWLWFYAEGNEREMVPTRFFIPEGVSPWNLLLRDALWENNLSTMCPSCTSDSCFHTVCPQVVSLTTLRSSAVPSGLYPSQLSWPLKFQTLSPLVARTQNPAPLIFKPMALRKHSPCAFTVVLLLLSCLFLRPYLPCLHSTHDSFFP